MSNGEKRIWLIFLAAALFLFDQSLKYLIRTSGGFYICNPGIAFGIDLPLGLVGLILFFLVLIFILSINNFKLQIKNESGNNLAGLTLILAGGLSNITDKFIHGCVVDFIDVSVFWRERFLFFPVFNLADMLIFLGAVILIWQIVTRNRKKVV